MEHIEQVNGSVQQPLVTQLEPVRYELTPVEQQYFRRMDRVIADLQQQMQGALQLIIDKHGIKGRVGLSEDRTHLVEQGQLGV